MKNIAFFCIPAHGHTNPMLAVAKALVARGDQVRFYSFSAFEEKIRATGAVFVPCDRFLGELTEAEQAGLMKVSTTEMTLQDIRTTLAMDSFLTEEIAAFHPDVIYSDSVCFWGKLIAWKHKIPLVVSTSTFAFNQLSSTYMKHSASEMADLILGLPKISKALKALEPCGYHVKNALSLVQSDDQTDSVVYASARFQPYAESFSAHYAFVGPSLLTDAAPNKAKKRPLIYISLGTVINDRPDFYAKCIRALGDMDADVVISCGSAGHAEKLGALPENIRALPRVDQLDVLSRADVFITHCGMNSVSESLYMATPMVLYPQTGEQQAVARRAAELGAGTMLSDDSADGLRAAVRKVLFDPAFAAAAAACSEDFRACSGPEGAASFIENAPHDAPESPLLRRANQACRRFAVLYRLASAALMVLTGLCAGWRYAWIPGVIAGVLQYPLDKRAQGLIFRRLSAQSPSGRA